MIKPHEIIRTKRKTIALVINEHARLVVRAPRFVSNRYIHNLIAKRKEWIQQKLEDAMVRMNGVGKKEFVNGESFSYLGNLYQLKLTEEGPPVVTFKNGFYLRNSKQNNARSLFVDWYKKVAYKKLLERVEFFADRSGFKFTGVRVTNARKRMGSCNGSGGLNFSWRLILAPLPIVDYVVVHELAHIKARDHSRKFWKIVETIMPDYKKRRKWLKENWHSFEI